MTWEVRQGDALELLRAEEPESVDCVMTSPPYWGLRDYGVDGQLGLEPHPSLYLDHLWTIMEEVKRVLKPTGTCWWNMGDSYGRQAGDDSTKDPESINTGYRKVVESGWAVKGIHRCPKGDAWLRPKQLLGIPWRFVIGCQDRGWLLRNDIIWAKPNPMPASVRDRFSCTYEHVFLLVKEPRYWFALDEVREPHAESSLQRNAYDWNSLQRTRDPRERRGMDTRKAGALMNESVGKNPGDVWRIPTQAFPLAHFATFPEALVERCVRAGCPPQVCSECGKPWVRVSKGHGESADRTRGMYAKAMGDMGRTFNSRASGYHGVIVRELGPWHQSCECASERYGGVCPPCGGNGKLFGEYDDKRCGSCLGTGRVPAESAPGLVLDPFCGSGTTGLVAVREGRRFLGFDISEEYCEMTRRRVAQAQPPLEMM